MALSSATIWEIRSGGSDTNGGGYVSGGTDWSLQNAAQYAVTDAVTNGTTTITSATANFGTDVVGNILYIAGGTAPITAGWYQIISRTNATTIVVDRSTGLTAGTGATLNIGGALASPAVACGAASTGNTIYVKYDASPYLITSTTANVAGGRLAPAAGSIAINLIGYDTDRSLNNSDANIPTLKASGISSTTIVSFNSTTSTARNIIVDCDSLSTMVAFGLGTGRGFYTRLKAMNSTTGFSATSHLYGCWAYNCTTGYSSCSNLYGCYAEGGTTGFAMSSGGQAHHCIADGCGGDGFTATAFGFFLTNCVAYGCTLDGFDSPAVGTVYVNCIAYGNGNFGFRHSTQTLMYSCAGATNTSGNFNGSPVQIPAFDHLSSDPFTDAAAGDFSLNNDSGEGLDCRGTGFPGIWFGPASTTGYPDIGAVQHQDTFGSGGGSFVWVG